MPFIDYNDPASWKFTDNNLPGLHRNTTYTGYKFITYQSFTNYTFKQDKNYQFIIRVRSKGPNDILFPPSPLFPAGVTVANRRFGSTLQLKLFSPFSTTLKTSQQSKKVYSRESLPGYPTDNNIYTGGRIYLYANPLSTLTTKNMISIGADQTLEFDNPNGSKITGVFVFEIDFLINGQREIAEGGGGVPDYGPLAANGWVYENSTKEYWWNYVEGNTYSMTFSTFGSGLPTSTSSGTSLQQGVDALISNTRDRIFSINYIARKIEYDYFNLQFDYATFSGHPSQGIDIYLGTNLANRSTWTIVGSLKNQTTNSVTHQLIGLTGSNPDGSKNFLIFSATQSLGGLSSFFTAKLSNIVVSGGYHPSNNEQLLYTNTSNFLNPTPLQVIGLVEATYSYITGFGSTIANTFSNISLTKAKMGNGLFKAGIWETGIWNNGWREDTNSKDFDEVLIAIPILKGIRWRIQITGPTESASNFSIGDKISIGNIIGIDINGERKLLKGYYTVVRKNDESLIIEVDTTFPLRRIEKDSQNHKIKITKNIWLSGAFLNGYFTGVWNSGLFKGLPFSTEMYETHWIDGKFDGGHFHSEYPSAPFDGTNYIIGSQWNLDSSFDGKLGLSFSSGHVFQEGDYILIDKDNKTFNPGYDGLTRVISVPNSKLIIVDKTFGNPSNNELGFVYRWTSTSLIQNFDFYDNNKSQITSNQSSISADVFNFNSWIDVNYDPTRSVTIGRVNRDFDRTSVRSVNRNNLYGFPTYDILSSNSWFRDSYSLQQRSYRLGTKYKIYNDPIAEGSNFTDPFEPQIFTDEILIKIATLKRNSLGTILSFSPTPAQNIKITVVPISTNKFNFSRPVVLCDIPEVTPVNTMVNNIVTAINNASKGYTASNDEGILTIRDLTGNSYGLKGLEIDAANYALKSDNSSGASLVIYPNQNVFAYEEPVANSNPNQRTTLNQSIIPGTEPIKFGRIIEGVGYDNLTNVGWEITQASFSNSDIRRTEPSDEDDNIRGEEIQINVVRDGITLNNTRIEIEQQRYSVVEFDIKAYDVFNTTYTYINEDTTYSKKGVQAPEQIEIPIIHLSNLNYDYVNTSRGQSRFTNGVFNTPVTRQYMPLTYLPVNQNINHIFTENTYRLDSTTEMNPTTYESQELRFRKYEYFFSKRDLMMKILGNGESGASPSFVVMDNIKMYEVDMIPFFKYFTEANIYDGVQVPFQATAPEINYEEADYNFLDNVSIGLDSLNIQSFGAVTSNLGGIPGLPPTAKVKFSNTLGLIFDSINSNTGVVTPPPIADQSQQPGNESTL